MEAIPKNHNLSKTSPKSLLIRFCNFSNKKILLFNIDLFHENFETTRRIQSEWYPNHDHFDLYKIYRTSYLKIFQMILETQLS